MNHLDNITYLSSSLQPVPPHSSRLSTNTAHTFSLHPLYYPCSQSPLSTTPVPLPSSSLPPLLPPLIPPLYHTCSLSPPLSTTLAPLPHPTSLPALVLLRLPSLPPLFPLPSSSLPPCSPPLIPPLYQPWSSST